MKKSCKSTGREEIADCKLQIADCRLQIADCRLQIRVVRNIIYSTESEYFTTYCVFIEAIKCAFDITPLGVEYY